MSLSSRHWVRNLFGRPKKVPDPFFPERRPHRPGPARLRGPLLPHAERQLLSSSSPWQKCFVGESEGFRAGSRSEDAGNQGDCRVFATTSPGRKARSEPE